MNDRNFLSWIHDRLQDVHGEDPQVDYMGKLRSIINALPVEQDTPNTAPDLENIRLATEAMVVDVGGTVKAGGRTWRLEAGLDRQHHSHPTQHVYFVDVASPAADFCSACTAEDYRKQVWHIRDNNGVALLSREKWAENFTTGQYHLDPAVVA